ncbi:MAG TPA: prepilin-type N-terminal cleavage/methylation domain-containing protein [Phycisphaerales bacterium]|nr:prepilin-type N-terminal cleavage/methylation domain-containing protein [Phycisphaerales bacterium]
MPRTSPLAQSARRAFTLVELLTVLGILAIVIAIIIPAMNLARRAAKNSDSLNTLSNLSKAISMFHNDKSRYPGYFSPRQMATAVNRDARGFTTMENMMLDLMGGIRPAGPRTIDGQGRLTIGAVGPGNNAPNSPNADQVFVEYAAMGAQSQSGSGVISGTYFVTDGKRMAVQGYSYNGSAWVTDTTKRLPASPEDHFANPVLVDSFGQPILAWAQDETPSGGEFAAENFAPATPAGAKFYWAQNAGFLKGVASLGKLAENQNFTPGNGSGGSLLAADAAIANRLQTMYALLGNPAAPDDAFASPNFRPATGRGPIVLHAAGADGVFVGNRDRGGKAGVVTYVPNQDKFNGPLFDDQIMAAGH